MNLVHGWNANYGLANTFVINARKWPDDDEDAEDDDKNTKDEDNVDTEDEDEEQEEQDFGDGGVDTEE
ncbi:MAG TPA: hypothetical protein VJG30_01080 [Candidatus Nanoarchaeia archaeon]|nr:hypothetical protein [Candidatus Nanoarchaeia archaeon]